MSSFKIAISLISITYFLFSCNAIDSTPDKETKLKVVTYQQFANFVDSTSYVTDAEKFGWSIVQQNVFDFITVDGATWKKPDGSNKPASKNLPVTQVSYNDAMAYCEWSNTRLPSYQEYWEMITSDNRKIITNNNAPISMIDDANILGNVWELTSTAIGESIRLAGGSTFCSPKTCNGTKKERELYVDKETGNVHIGFAVIAK